MLELCTAFERAIIAERVGAGLARAKAQGRKLGRPEVDPFLIEDMRSMRAEGHSLRFIADRLGVGRGTVEKYTKGKTPAA
jgi:DNA invertase Pin-like site-specific DNA recombinase